VSQEPDVRMDQGRGGLADPTSLPLFRAPLDPAQPTGRGRVRSPFRLVGVPENVPSAGTTGPPAGLPRLPAIGPEQGPAGRFTDPDGRFDPDFGVSVSGGEGGRHGAGVDWLRVAEYRSAASQRLAANRDRARLSTPQQQELGRAVILEMLHAAAAEDLSAGREPLADREQERLAQAVFDALFRLGRLQPLVDDEAVENIEINGCDNVLLQYADGTLVPGPPVADTDGELIEFLQFLGTRSEVNARPFSESQPQLHMRLDGGSRLAAIAWVTPRPVVVIRRHRLVEVTLDDLVANDTIDPVAASFLDAAIKAKKSVVVSGAQGAGKTTLVRALCFSIGKEERIGTFETEFELHLHEMPHRFKRVIASEARPGSGEVGLGGRQAGEITLMDLLNGSFRFNLDRQIVGEVRGPEMLAMLKAMNSGAGSICTTHAADAEGAIRKLVTCAMEAGPQISRDAAIEQLANNIDFVVHVTLDNTPGSDGTSRRDRWVSQILAIGPGERDRGYATTTVFAPAPAGRGMVPGVLPDGLRSLRRWGFDLDGYLARGGPTDGSS